MKPLSQNDRIPTPQDELAEAVRDLGYAIAKPLGVIALCRRLGLRVKPWVIEREEASGES